MKCPSCGQEIQAEHLYCEKCGMEIRIVPDFEPEIENSIHETLSTVAEEIEEETPVKEAEPAEEDLFSQENPGRNWIKLKLIAFAVVVALAAFAGLMLYFNYAVSYQVKRARELAGQGKYEEELKILEKASERDSLNSEVAFLLADCYYRLNRKDEALEVLKKQIDHGLAEEDRERVYEGVIQIYDEQGNYEAINSLLSQCTDESITTVFQRYMALAPEYSCESGDYEEIIHLRLSANTTGTIYYTLDGSTPTSQSEIYLSPITLETGRYQVNAVFVNDYGIQSEVVRNWYEINLTVPEAPAVTPESGNYTVPMMIEAEIPEDGDIYYTTDGSEPNEDSILYTGPFEMPLGRSNYKFVMISREGVRSEVSGRSYNFDLNTGVTVSMAVSNVAAALVKRGVLNDTQGHAAGVTGRYVFRYQSVELIGETYYYILNEYYVETNGSETKEERMYAVDTVTGKPNRLIYDEQGQMGLISLADAE